MPSSHTHPVDPAHKPLVVVFDTNVVMDLLHFDDPVARPLAEALRQGSLRALADDETLAELARVVTYPIFRLNAATGEALVADYTARVRRQAPGPLPYPLPRCRDADDQKFLELAARGKAELLISKDKAVLALAPYARSPHGQRALTIPFQILPPAAAVDYIRRRNTQVVSSDASGA